VFGPILPYDLITSSRRGRWYFLRMLLTGAMLVIFWQAASRLDPPEVVGGSRANSRAAKAEFAAAFYTSFAWIHVSATLLLAAAFLGGSIADDRRRKLLEFMFTTDLTAREIILGKFAGRTFMIAALLAGSLPILACTMLFGGVSGEWIAQLGLLTVTTLVCFGGLSVLISTTVARPRDAVVRALAVTSVLVALPPFFGAMARGSPEPFWQVVETIADRINMLNPYAVIYSQTNGPAGAGAAEYVWNRTLETAAAQAAVGAVALLLAVFTVRRTVTHTAAAAVAKKRWSISRRFFRPKLGRWPPVLWREAFGEPAAKPRGWIGRMVGALIFLSINIGIVATWLATERGDLFGTPHVLITMGPLACLVAILFLIMVGTRAAGSVTAEHEADTWTTLLAGPINADSIVAGKVMGAVLSFRRLLVPFLLVWFLIGLSMPVEALVRALAVLCVGFLMAFVNANIGFHYSMRSKSTTSAVVKTVLAVLFLGGGYILVAGLLPGFWGGGLVTLSQFFHVCFPVFVQISDTNRGTDEIAPYFLIGCVIYLVFGATLYGINRAAFDSRNGRTIPRRPIPAPPREPTAQTN